MPGYEVVSEVPVSFLTVEAPLAAGRRLGPDHWCTGGRSTRGGADDRYVGRAGAAARSLHRGQQSPRYGPLARGLIKP